MIRELQLDDEEMFDSMLLECGNETQRLFQPHPNFFKGYGFRYLATLAMLKRKVYVLLLDNGIQGVGYYYLGPELTKAYFSILISDQYQRRGYGTELLTFMEQHARSDGFKAIRTSGGTHLEGPLYHLLLKREYSMLGHHYGDSVMMEKRL